MSRVGRGNVASRGNATFTRRGHVVSPWHPFTLHRAASFRLLPLVLFAVLQPLAPARGADDWSALGRWQHSITAGEFDRALATVYAPANTLGPYLERNSNSVAIYSTADHSRPPVFTLELAATASDRRVCIPGFKNADQLRQLHNPTNSPLHGLRFALDPGHIGGEWARTEERFFIVHKGDRPVQEATLNLTVARLLKTRLEAAGATVSLTKNDFQPVTDQRPDNFHAEAAHDPALAERFEAYPPLEREAALADAIRKRQESLFYRRAELAARARLINEVIQPDLTLCLHFNAVEWNERFELVEDNRLVLFVHGNYLPGELADDAQKRRLLAKMLERSHPLELSIADAIANSLARKTGLPPFAYAPGTVALRMDDNPYVYARNLAANRLADGPVVYLEPYYQNNRIVYQRLQWGDYDGTRSLDGREYPSIFREYADAVAEAVIGFYAPLTTAQ